MKLPITNVGKKIAKHVPAPSCVEHFENVRVEKKIHCKKKRRTFSSALMQSHNGSIHSPHKMRKIIINEWKKSLKFHLNIGQKENTFDDRNKKRRKEKSATYLGTGSG